MPGCVVSKDDLHQPMSVLVLQFDYNFMFMTLVSWYDLKKNTFNEFPFPLKISERMVDRG